MTNKKMVSKKKTAKRMYVIVPYSLSPIQQGIQALHAVIEYVVMAFRKPTLWKPLWQWMSEDKTIVILNGGTTNNGERENEEFGSLQIHHQNISGMVPTSKFFEPDLNNAMTAFAFIVDETVFSYKGEVYEKYQAEHKLIWAGDKTAEKLAEWSIYTAKYKKFVSDLHGEKNAALCYYLKQLRLA